MKLRYAVCLGIFVCTPASAQFGFLERLITGDYNEFDGCAPDHVRYGVARLPSIPSALIAAYDVPDDRRLDVSYWANHPFHDVPRLEVYEGTRSSSTDILIDGSSYVQFIAALLTSRSAIVNCSPRAAEVLQELRDVKSLRFRELGFDLLYSSSTWVNGVKHYDHPYDQFLAEIRDNYRLIGRVLEGWYTATDERGVNREFLTYSELSPLWLEEAQTMLLESTELEAAALNYMEEKQ